MSKTIQSKTIGPLKQTDFLPDWWESADIAIPYCDNKPLCICITDYVPGSDQKFMEEADVALANFLALTNADRLNISALVVKNYTDYMESADEENKPVLTLNDDTDIWNYVTPKEIYLSRRDRRDKDIYIQIDCDCTWEQEYGLQLILRQGKKITRVSEIDGELTDADAYDIPDEQDELLAKF